MKKISILAALALIPFFGFSQGSFFGMSYQVSVPVGETSDFISQVSGRGFGIDYKGFISPEVALGGTVAWNVFYEAVPSATYETEDGNGAISGQQWRYINSFPFLFTADYFIGDYGMTRMFVGGGIGAYRMYQRTDMGIYTTEPREWMFGIAPEAGVIVPMNRDALFMATLRFNYAFESGSIQNTSYLGINLGFAWN